MIHVQILLSASALALKYLLLVLNSLFLLELVLLLCTCEMSALGFLLGGEELKLEHRMVHECECRVLSERITN